jgi:hypothetical protein
MKKRPGKTLTGPVISGGHSLSICDCERTETAGHDAKPLWRRGACQRN